MKSTLAALQVQSTMQPAVLSKISRHPPKTNRRQRERGQEERRGGSGERVGVSGEGIKWRVFPKGRGVSCALPRVHAYAPPDLAPGARST